jgi:putative SOS response-associated peptidase YedK
LVLNFSTPAEKISPFFNNTHTLFRSNLDIESHIGIPLRKKHDRIKEPYIMCGRFVIFSNLEKLQQHFPLDKALSEITPNYNVAPTQEILAIIYQEGLNVLEKLNWGLFPHWAKDVSAGYKMINARMETVSSKPSFRNAFRKRRCLIPADGFYEWSGPKGDKQPFFMTLPRWETFCLCRIMGNVER